MSIWGLASQVKALNDDFVRTKENIKNLQNGMGDFKTALVRELDRLQDGNADLSEKYAKAQAEKAANTVRVTSLEKEVAVLREDTAKLTQTVHQLLGSTFSDRPPVIHGNSGKQLDASSIHIFGSYGKAKRLNSTDLTEE